MLTYADEVRLVNLSNSSSLIPLFKSAWHDLTKNTGTRFTCCFTSTKVQIMTPEELPEPAHTQFTCFTSTKAQILTALSTSEPAHTLTYAGVC